MHSLLCLLHFLLCLFHLQQFKPQTSVAVAAVCYFPDERPADSPPQQTISTYLVCLACFLFLFRNLGLRGNLRGNLTKETEETKQMKQNKQNKQNK